jgi:hypothetical protein
LRYAFNAGARHFCVQYPNVPTSVAFLTKGLKAVLATFGHGAKLTYFYVSPLTFSSADAATFAAQVHQKGCDAVEINAGLTADQLILQAAVQAGIYPNQGVQYLASGLYAPGAIAALGSAGTGVITESFTVPIVGTGLSPQLQQAQRILAQVPAQYRDSYAALGYESAWLLQHVLGTISGPVTRASILGALKTTKVTLPLQPSEFDFTQSDVSAGSPRSVPQGAGIITIKAGQFQVLDKWLVVK